MLQDIFSLQGKKVLISGASGAIGTVCAQAVVAFGAHAVLVGRSEHKLAAVKPTIDEVKTDASHVTYHAINFEDLREMRAFFTDHADADVLINSVGINIPKDLLDITEEDYDTQMNTNVKSAFFQTQYFVEAKRQRECTNSASIIHISSQMGHVGGDKRSVYCASKHALEGMCKAAALELGQWNIRINTICPTFIETPLSRVTLNNPTLREAISNSIVFKRIGRLEELYGAVVYLASDASSLVTGSALKVDGGWTAR